MGSSYRGRLLASLFPAVPTSVSGKPQRSHRPPAAGSQTVAPQSPGIHTLKCGVYVTLDGTEGILVMLFLPDDCKMTSCRNKWNKRGELRSSPKRSARRPQGERPCFKQVKLANRELELVSLRQTAESICLFACLQVKQALARRGELR